MTCILMPTVAFAAIAKQATDYDDTSAGDSSETTAITVDSGSDILLVAGIGSEDSTEADSVISSITCNTTETMTQAKTYFEGVNRVDIWYLINPTVGSYNCVTAYAGTVSDSVLNFSVYTGAKQSAQPDAVSAGESGAGFPATPDVTTVAANCVIVDVVDGNLSTQTAVEPTAGQTEILDTDTANHTVGVGYEIVTTATAYSQTWSATGGGSWDAIAVSFAPVAPTGIKKGSVIVTT